MATILAYRMDYLNGSSSEWYCPTCHAELEDPEAGTDHIRYVEITDVADLPDEGDDFLGMKRCDADCGRFLATGKTLFEMAEA